MPAAARIKFIKPAGAVAQQPQIGQQPRAGYFQFCLRKTPFGQFRKLTQNFLLNGGQVCTAASGGCGQDALCPSYQLPAS